MYIEKDLEKIKLLARKRMNENLKFRSYMKWVDMESSEIDSVVHRIYNEVTEQIDCTECANCCNTSTPSLDDKDINIFVRSLEIKEEEFRDKYLKEAEADGNKKIYQFNSLPCPFLKNNLCTNYDNRPKDCQSFPHLHKIDFNSRLSLVIDNLDICPIVFNVFEELKVMFWRKGKF